MKKNLKKIALLCMLGFFTACSDDDGTVATTDQTIAEIASSNPNLSSLVAALNRAGLVETLNGSTEYTVFAPTNDAFDKFLDDNNFADLNAVPLPLLREVLKKSCGCREQNLVTANYRL